MIKTLSYIVTKVLCVSICTFLLTGCSSYKSTEAIDECKDLVLNKLRAPSSAIFSDVSHIYFIFKPISIFIYYDVCF